MEFGFAADGVRPIQTDIGHRCARDETLVGIKLGLHFLHQFLMSEVVRIFRQCFLTPLKGSGVIV